MSYYYQDLIQIFDTTFGQTYNTRLIEGGNEPIYLPQSKECDYNQVVFAHDYYSSALHEIAHWCHAGAKRRLVEDYGYWYVPDGRDEEQQAKFEQVEIIPQAIEWAFNVAVQKEFHVSSDNLDGFQADINGFKAKVFQQVIVFIEQGFPSRANQFIVALAQFYKTQLPLAIDDFVNNKVDDICSN